MPDWVKMFEQQWKSAELPKQSVVDVGTIKRAKKALAENMGWIDQFSCGWWVQNIGRFNWQHEFTMFPTEFAARMFAAGMSDLMFLGYGEVHQDVSDARKKQFKQLPQP